MKECPRCLGEKTEYSPKEDKMVPCCFCKGQGRINWEEEDDDFSDFSDKDVPFDENIHGIQDVQEDEDD